VARMVRRGVSVALAADGAASNDILDMFEETRMAALLHKGANGESECGIWHCTPGKWFCHVTSDEFCHFLEGHCTYVHESGEVIEITPDTAAFFPKDWKGVCTVHETVKKVYMIR